MNSQQILVVGSANVDHVIDVGRLPAAGETLLGSGHVVGFGGKGANQAIACARLGGDVAFLACVGNDSAGADFQALLTAEGIDCQFVSGSSKASTGAAFIFREPQGENRIVVIPGANDELDAQSVNVALAASRSPALVLAQLEVPVESVLAAFYNESNYRILNAAPAGRTTATLLGCTDLLIVNETELAEISGGSVPADADEAADLARSLSGPSATIVTLGAQGAVLVQRDEPDRVFPGRVVEVIDTTAAGDSFCAAVAVNLAEGVSLEDSVARAIAVSALVVTRSGAISSLPSLDEVRDQCVDWS